MNLTLKDLEKLHEHWYDGGRLSDEQVAALLHLSLKAFVSPEVESPLPWTPEETARRFHEAYEFYAPYFGYITREDTRAWDPESNNGKLMIAVVRAVLIEQARSHMNNGSKS